jgi:two-component system cell cycle sensor histidine kinase/response regulator CckA
LAASDGQEALEPLAAYTNPIHLLLTDIVMPRMDGLTLTDGVHTLRPGMRVIVMSGETLDIIRTDNRPDAFLRKPFKPPTLLKCVQTALAGATQVECAE